MKSAQKAEVFYGALLDILLDNNIPFMIGGTYAFTEYTGIKRPTKDMDIMCTVEDYPQILKLFNDAGYKTDLHELELNWIAKVYDDEHNFADVIFGERNGLYKIDKTWLHHARQGTVFGHVVKLVPIEDLIRSKAYVQARERYDGADVIHLILKHGKTLDWSLLLTKMDPHWEILFAHLLNFSFVYPSEREAIPEWVLKKLLEKAENSFSKPPLTEKVTRGLLISSQYSVAVSKWGYKPIRDLQ